jgi:hypothetical protein
MRITTISEALRAALSKNLEGCWLYLRSAENPCVNSECILVPYTEEEPEIVASSHGFVQEGLDRDTLEDVAGVASQFVPAPSDELLLESFIYYWRFDAWLPFPGAPEPPPADVIAQNEARKFYDSLGAERASVKCRAQGCDKGAVPFSVLCKKHHFEMVRKIPCPFTH